MRTFLHRLFTKESHGIAASALIVSGASLLSRLLGVVRDRLLAGHFGAGIELDAYYAAFRIPDMLFNLFIAGALSAGFIPLFSEYLEQRTEKDAWELAAEVLAFLTVLMGLVALLFAIFAPALIPLIAKGFTAEGLAYTIQMSRLMAISPILLGISGIMGAVLQAKKRFVAFALAPLFYNIGILIGIIVFSRWYGIIGVALGVVLGAALHAIVQFLPAFQLGFRQSWRLRLPSEGVKRLLKIMLPRTASLAVSQVNLLIILALASSLSVGSVALFSLATNIQSLPFGLIGVSLAVASFPILAQAVNQQQEEKFIQVLFKQLRWMWFLLAPITIWMLFLAPDIIYVVLGNGKFDPTQVTRLASILRVLAIAIPAQSFVALLVRAFYAKQNTWRPFTISVIAEVVNIALCFLLRSSLGLEGLAVAFTISAIVNASGLWFFLPGRREITRATYYVFFRSVIQVIVASGAMVVVVVLLGRYFPLRTFALRTVVAHTLPIILLPGGIYLLSAHLLGLSEPVTAWKRLASLRKK